MPANIQYYFDVAVNTSLFSVFFAMILYFIMASNLKDEYKDSFGTHLKIFLFCIAVIIVIILGIIYISMQFDELI